MKRFGLAIGVLVFFLSPASHVAKLVAEPSNSSSTLLQSSANRDHGSLEGHVLTDAGQALSNAKVTIARMGYQGGVRARTAVTDEKGRFQINSLASGRYRVSVRAAGYVRADNAKEMKYYSPGDYIAITMLKGGVITGTVKSPSGDPLIRVPVHALRLRDSERRANIAPEAFTSRLTDDRGVYRIYGLAPGEYIVSAGGGTRSYAGFNKFERDCPTYYPSSTRQTAERISLQPGQEVSDVNIVWLGEAGQVVSGVASGPKTGQSGSSIAVALVEQATGEIRDIGNTVQEGAFAFYGVPDGEYYLIARSLTGIEKDAAISQPSPVRVAGSSVLGVRVPLLPSGSVSGRVALEPLPKEKSDRCDRRQRIRVEELILTLEREIARGEPEILWQTSRVDAAPDERGLFSVYGLTGGQYRITIAVPTEQWFTKTISITAAPVAQHKSGTDSVEAGPLASSIRIQSGGDVYMNISVAEGAARLSGRVGQTNGQASAGMSVYLVPLDRKDVDNPLRFVRTDARLDGTFAFDGIAPGKYSIFAHRVGAETASDSASSYPSPWNAAGRAFLRSEAKRSRTTVELQSCQTTPDYVVQYPRQ
ncbi:MAG TPA: carboxypeptidase-like regulatory domain-containing protein [Blastocatellia bacterium]|nr:carboxypeptidase-like regulatory domain-containing protein [Blastocatellia bacterium]